MLVISFGFLDVQYSMLKVNIFPFQISGFRGADSAAVQKPKKDRAGDLFHLVF